MLASISRLGFRIAMIGIVALAGLTTVVVVQAVSNGRQERIAAVFEQAKRMSVQKDRIALGLLELRRAENDFLLLADDQYVTAHARRTQTVRAQRDVLEDLASAQGFDVVGADARQLGRLIDAYVGQFAALAERRIALGLKETLGLEGSLRRSVHAIEQVLDQTADNPRLTILMLMMRRHEKDFMARREARYGDMMRTRATEFLATLDASRLNPADQATIRRSLVNYQRDFFAYVAGVETLMKAQQAVSASYSAVEPVFTRIEAVIQGRVAQVAAESDVVRNRMMLIRNSAIAATFLIVALLMFLIGRSIARPLVKAKDAMDALASGQFDVEMPGLRRRDEIGDIARSLERFKAKLQEKNAQESAAVAAARAVAERERKEMASQLAERFEAAVGEVVSKVSSLAGELEAAADSLAASAEQTRDVSSDVAAASEEAAGNAMTVAQATAELSVATGEIQARLVDFSKMSEMAAQQTKESDGRMVELAQTASRVSDIVALIAAIAEQTNLLALNATIEAARAGEAGRGFAVVASEVKQLAGQTAGATASITQQIEAMRQATHGSVESMQSINATVRRMAQMSAEMATMTEQQTSATLEISRNTQQTAAGATQIIGRIQNVSQAASLTGNSAAHLVASARDLNLESRRLSDEVKSFLAVVRAA